MESLLHSNNDEMSWLITMIKSLSKDSSTTQAQLNEKIQSMSKELSALNVLKLNAEENLQAKITKTKNLDEELHFTDIPLGSCVA
jgi:hypothetical protein